MTTAAADDALAQLAGRLRRGRDWVVVRVQEGAAWGEYALAAEGNILAVAPGAAGPGRALVVHSIPRDQVGADALAELLGLRGGADGRAAEAMSAGAEVVLVGSSDPADMAAALAWLRRLAWGDEPPPDPADRRRS